MPTSEWKAIGVSIMEKEYIILLGRPKDSNLKGDGPGRT